MSPRPADANTTRSVHLRRLYRHPAAITVAAVALVAGLIVAVTVNALAGAGGGFGALLLIALVLWVIADAKAEEDFFKAYAEERGLSTGGGQGSIPPATDLLREGVRRYTDRTFAGRLADGVDGLLAYYTYETETRDSKGRKQVQYHNFTVVLTEIPEAATFLLEMACQRRAGFSLLRLRRGQVPQAPAGRDGKRGGRQALRDLHRRGRRHEPGAPAPLADLRRLALHLQRGHGLRTRGGLARRERPRPARHGGGARRAV